MVVNLRCTKLLKTLQTLNKPLTITSTRDASTSSTTRQAEAVFVEQPLITITDKDNVDLIGPPDPVSNLRPIVRKHCLHETELQQRLRLMQDETHLWNQKFWTAHNTSFNKERQLYVKQFQETLEENRALTADEMSGFYKKFLDDNWRKHVGYNIEWYKRNFTLLFLALRASLPQSLHFISKNQ